MTLQPCLHCGELAQPNRCPEHRTPEAKASAAARGYDYTWQKLSERARRLQPFCTDCYGTSDLTSDHTETAWKRKAEGKVIRLRDVDVVCRPCNAKRGAARPRGGNPLQRSARPAGKAESATLSKSGLHGYFVNLVRRMSCPLMDSLYRFSVRRFGETEDGACLGVRPGVLKVHALFVLDSQISSVGLVKTFCSDTVHSGVHVHELGHSVAPSCRRFILSLFQSLGKRVDGPQP